MTLFDKTQQTPSAETPPEGKYFEALVGEGKKFKDQDALARGKWEADIYAARLEAELAEMRNEVKSRITLEDAIREIKAAGQGQPPSNQQAHQPGEQGSGDNAQPKQLSQEDIDALLEAKLNKRQQELRANENIEIAKRELRKAWGANALTQLEAKAAELGMQPQELDALAARSPKALLKLVGADTQAQQEFTPPPRSTLVPPSGGANGGGKNYAFYQKMLREDPTRYYDKATQQEMYKLAMSMGEAFYK